MLARRTVPLLLAVAALAAGCARRPSAARDPHAAVACVGCHRALPADTGRGPVPDIACTASGCHAGGGSDSAHLATVTFAHKRHPDGRGGSARCATCHRHVPGSVAMVADTSACALCHVKDLVETRSRQPDCRSCHAHPRHSPETSQGVPISHALLDVEKVPCTRCHYQVSEGTPTAVGKCQGCHRDSTVAAVRNADSLHASHRSYGCGTCHAPVRHRVVAMSTSVSLACRDCHAPGHRRRIPADTSSTASCSDCHQEVHAEEQRLILGLLPGEPIRPSPMFMGGVTCRSCHVAPGRPGPAVGRPLVSNEAACTGCHGAQWSGILGRWRRGYERRSGWVNGYLAAAARVFADSARPATARTQVRQAQSLLAFLQAAGALHNLPATDRIMRHALELAGRAYREAGMTPPPVPELGPPVRTGTCMSCHYGVEEVQAARDSTTGRPLKHADHLFRAYLPCDACHAVGAAPPGLPDSLWIDTMRLDRGGPASRRRSPR